MRFDTLLHTIKSPYLRNKYVISISIFVVWLAFFDQHNVISQIQWRSELGDLLEDKAYYISEIESTKKNLQELLTNPDQLERFAREKYLMKKNDETVFVFVAK